MRANIPFILLALILAVLALLIWYFWRIFLALLVLGWGIWEVYQYFWQRFGCVRCGGTGIIGGADLILDIHFHQGEPCYMCGGKKIPPKDRRSWNNIAKKAAHKLHALQLQEELVLKEMEQFRKSMKFSASTDENIVFAHGNLLGKKYKQLAAIESEIEAYDTVYKQSIINAHNIYLIGIMDKERMDIEHWDDQQLDTMSDSLSDVRDTTFLQQSDFMPLLEQQNQDYLPLISEPMRKDIDTAVEAFKALVKHRTKH